MGITPLEKANHRLGKTASLWKNHAGGWELWEWRGGMGMDGSHADGRPCGLAAAMALLHTEQMLKGKEGQKNHPWDECPLDGSIFCVESSGITPHPFFLRVLP